ncbi:MAG: hypothetical protein A2700_00125 [Candidatus Blackburnbacteria bacterium RIFCSPHIGHO2_01_FULL_44_64]|uniref:Glycosyltransferase 2-like domain-containing protein n=1 Tax=Candidatus Blackburnbacteria bacterium RIFCSPHIGHO2_02_FULL_44_20 TaxID=1797516 RepID=A0A1G1V853_9BACT|nr:MAG: hypothetical protein A2700_00125 [Candidatus Blackburnbacteria bacterium RIFCSPHIGHO2_01_FULL_44_64]OGY11543.1 MAG: hypothetical protein A3D26_03265 [Candidatus Blackburnbacteria bacterium RIFCSPHIGHO2_02_FULL_44_20]OGY14100.1 MAG: hypothetical protein A3A62_01930 [Candidatus Blackburnbacteria bacterium RIFCSPLOWO2_01_FULL_44_43]OGY15758.1 MAG: hypothetical protein A3H88_02460 [Candidatus Blackburnbacteria bacterium RIFCSPLOWO2_02_FULL_44_9]
MKSANPDISIVIVSFNTKNLTKSCVESILKYTRGVNLEIIIVDNASTDGSVEEIQKFTKKQKETHLLKNRKNLGFGGGNNLGMKRAKGKYILLLNSDTKLHEDSISKMVQWMDNNNNVGMSTCKLTNPNGTTQANGGFFPTLPRLLLWTTFLDDLPLVGQLFGSYHMNTKGIMGDNSSYEKTHPQDWISGAFMMLRRTVFENMGGFRKDIFMYAEDVEYCYRIKKAGVQIQYAPITSITHIGSASSGGETVKFIDTSMGKESSILGEFKGLSLFYKIHFPMYQSVARILLKFGALLRIIVFGFFLGQKPAIRIYAKAFQVS